MFLIEEGAKPFQAGIHMQDIWLVGIHKGQHRCMGKAVDNLVESLSAGLVPSLIKGLGVFEVSLCVVFLRLLALWVGA